MRRCVTSSLSLSGREECVVDYSLELVTVACKLKELITRREMSHAWVTLLHQFLLVAAANITYLQTPRAGKLLRLLTQACEGAGQWLLGKEPATHVSEAEVSSLNVDFMLALLKVANSSDAMRVEAGRCGCYRIVNTVLVYLLRYALQHGEVAITPLAELAPLTIRVPVRYQLLPKGVTSVTPRLFHQAESSQEPQWSLDEAAREMELRGVLESSVDVLTRLMIHSIVTFDVGQRGRSDVGAAHGGELRVLRGVPPDVPERGGVRRICEVREESG